MADDIIIWLNFQFAHFHFQLFSITIHLKDKPKKIELALIGPRFYDWVGPLLATLAGFSFCNFSYSSLAFFMASIVIFGSSSCKHFQNSAWAGFICMAHWRYIWASGVSGVDSLHLSKADSFLYQWILQDIEAYLDKHCWYPAPEHWPQQSSP